MIFTIGLVAGINIGIGAINLLNKSQSTFINTLSIGQLIIGISFISFYLGTKGN